MGSKCDGFMFSSNLTDPLLNTVNILHKGIEHYDNLWGKVRSMLSYAYDNYYTKYDWFHISGDDLFLIVENLKFYLDSDEIRTASNGGYFLPSTSTEQQQQTPLYLGRRYAYLGNRDEMYNAGGSGYTLNKAALKLLVTQGLESYGQNDYTPWDDLMVGRVLKHYGVLPYVTTDMYGSERYNDLQPGTLYSYRIPENITNDWYATYSIDIKEGLNHSSTYSIAYHYVKDDFQKRLYALLYNLCPSEALE
jgi:glycoprotein-N-acetylgalactosamine 3-beta-galactosyltransferase